MIGAVIAAVAAAFNLWLTFYDRRDSILVRYGSHTPIETSCEGLYIVNTGKHPVYISDFGFITPSGELFSIPLYDQMEACYQGEDPNAYYIGTRNIAPHEFFSIGISYNEKILGVYAITSTQNIKRVNMIQSRLWPHVFLKYLKATYWARYC